MKRYFALFCVLLVTYVAYQEWRWQVENPEIEPSVQETIDRSFVPSQPIPDPASFYSDKERMCMALNIFHEAGVEDEAGKIAVGQVTLNRVRSGRWGKSICDVVYAPSQFSWTLVPERLNAKPKGPLWEASLVAATKVLAGRKIKPLEHSLFYHTDYIKQPRWADTRNKITQLGQHIFYSRDKVVVIRKKT